MTFAEIIRLKEYLNSVELGNVEGTPKNPCSISAINFILYGKATDALPPCVCPSIWEWVMWVQDMMPHGLRNHPEWKGSLPHIVGTSTTSPLKNAKVIRDWLMGTVLQQINKGSHSIATHLAFGASSLGEEVKLINNDAYDFLMSKAYADLQIDSDYFSGWTGKLLNILREVEHEFLNGMPRIIDTDQEMLFWDLIEPHKVLIQCGLLTHIHKNHSNAGVSLSHG